MIHPFCFFNHLNGLGSNNYYMTRQDLQDESLAVTEPEPKFILTLIWAFQIFYFDNIARFFSPIINKTSMYFVFISNLRRPLSGYWYIAM